MTPKAEEPKKVAMDVNLKQAWVAHVRSRQYRACQNHLAKEGFGSFIEYTPLGILVKLAGVPYEWKPDPHGHDAMYVGELYESLPDDVAESLGLTTSQVVQLMQMANGGQNGFRRVYPATFNQMAQWIHDNIETTGTEDPSAEIGPSPDLDLNRLRLSPRTRGSGDLRDNPTDYSAFPRRTAAE